MLYYLQRTGALQVNNRLPNLVNLSEDPQLSEMLLYILKNGKDTLLPTHRACSHLIHVSICGKFSTLAKKGNPEL